MWRSFMIEHVLIVYVHCTGDKVGTQGIELHLFNILLHWNYRGKFVFWAQIFKLLRSLRIDSKEPIPPGCVALRASTKPYSYSVPSPQRLFKNSSTDFQQHLADTQIGVLTAFNGKLRNIASDIFIILVEHWQLLVDASARNYRHNFRENKPKTLVFNDWIRAFWVCFHENAGL